MGEPAEALGFPQPFGKYTLLKEIARGGMAEIFLAMQTGLQGFTKLVVIKRILPEFSRNRAFCDMLLDEARIAATFNHPNVIQVLDVGVEAGRYYIAMEYLAGENLRTVSRALRARNTGFRLEHSLSIVSDVCAGLHYAHTHEFGGRPLRIVHRDVSPKNIIITFDGTTRIVDFGIAKATDKIFETRSGVLKGSLPYMSPEQARGDDLDHRSDIFSVGIILYELTTGRRLFKETSDFFILRKIISERIVRPREIVAGYPAQLEAVVLRALARERAGRYATARQMQEDLDAFARAEALAVGPIHLGAFVQELFADKIAAQREAERNGTFVSYSASERSLDGDSEADSDAAGATGETRADSSVRRRKNRRAERARFLGAFTMAVVLAGVTTAGILWTRDRGAGEATTRSSPVPMPSIEPMAIPAIEPVNPRVDPAVAGDVVDVFFESEPTGADILLYGQLLGRTPVELPVARGGRPLQFVLRKSGFRDVIAELTPLGPSRVRVPLERGRSGRADRSPASQAPAPAFEIPAPPRDDLVDPYR